MILRITKGTTSNANAIKQVKINFVNIFIDEAALLGDFLRVASFLPSNCSRGVPVLSRLLFDETIAKIRPPNKTPTITALKIMNKIMLKFP
jgi:hypothetical protein